MEIKLKMKNNTFENNKRCEQPGDQHIIYILIYIVQVYILPPTEMI